MRNAHPQSPQAAKAAKVPDIAADINAEAAANEGTAVPNVPRQRSRRKSAESAETEREGGGGKCGIDRNPGRQLQGADAPRTNNNSGESGVGSAPSGRSAAGKW